MKFKIEKFCSLLFLTNISNINDAILSIVIQLGGKIVAGGVSNNYFALVRYNINGSLKLIYVSNKIKKIVTIQIFYRYKISFIVVFISNI